MKTSKKCNISLSNTSHERIKAIKKHYKGIRLKLTNEDIINTILTNISQQELERCVDNLMGNRESAVAILSGLETGALTQNDLAELLAKARKIDEQC